MNIKEWIEHPFMIIGTYVLIIFFVVASTKAYLWYLSVQQTIQSNQQRNQMLLDRITYLRDFRLVYLDSEYARYFTSHENGVAQPGEQILKIEKKDTVLAQDNVIVSPSGQVQRAPMQQKGWENYFRYKLQQINGGK
jgi:hypothetical protein